MNTKLSTPQRIQIGLVLAMAFLLVLGSIRLDSRHFTKIQTSVNSVYKDRVVVQGFIYRLSKFFHEKELRLLQKEAIETDASDNAEIDALLVSFQNTELTPKEADLLKSLKNSHSSLTELEKQLPMDDQEDGTEIYKEEVFQVLQEIQQDMDGLAAIQLSESEQLTGLSNKALGTNILLSKLEVAFLVVIGIAMLALIFNPMKTIRKTPEIGSLN